MHESRLPRAAGADDHHETGEGKGDVESAEVPGAGAPEGEPLFRIAGRGREPIRAARGMGDATPQEATRDRAAGRTHLGRRALCEDASAVNPGSGAEVDQVIRPRHEFSVMLDHKYRIPFVAQSLQGRDQSLIVAGVKPDAWFIEYIEHPGEIGPELRRQSNSLGLAAGERVRRPVEREVPQTHLIEKAQPLANRWHDFLENQAAARINLDAAQAAEQSSGRLGEQLWK